MSFLKKIWKDRQAEHPARRLLTNVSNNDVMMVDVSRAEGEVLSEGDAFDQENMNDLETRIKNAFDDDNESMNALSKKIKKTEEQLNDFSFGIRADGKAGYRRGASTEIIPFKTTEVFYLGEGTSFDIKSKIQNVDYRSLTANNFIAKAISVSGSSTHKGDFYGSGAQNYSWAGSAIANVNISYDKNNGIATINGTSCGWNTRNSTFESTTGSGNANVNCGLYLIIGDITRI